MFVVLMPFTPHSRFKSDNLLLVPVKFVVPQDDVSYPPETWGIKLDRNVSHIRNSGAYSEHKVKLEELGFEFKKNKEVMKIV
jgi:hypothetical protein